MRMEKAQDQDRFLDQVRRIVLHGLQGYPARVYLFGSRAGKTAGTGSDCDVAVEIGPDAPVNVLSRIREELEESRVPFEVELVVLADVQPELARQVKRKGILWQDSMSG
jgi:hypothetical protein